MAAQILDGKAISAELRGTIAQRVARLREKGVTPGLAVILVGADPASQIYVRNKSVGCDQVGIHSVTINLPETTTQDELEKLIARLNADDTIHGILVQLPLPKHLDEAAALAVIAPEKDVDGFHLLNAGRMMSGQPGVVACTPKGAMEMIRRTGIDLDGKEAVVVGRSNIGRQADGDAAAASELHRHHLPQPHGEPRPAHAQCGYSRRGGRQAGVHHQEHGQARRGRHRRGYQPRERQGRRRRDA